MEPIKTTKTARLRRLKMYREDLDELVAFFQKSCASVTISDGKHRYESLEEMKAHIGTRIKNFDIRGERPSLHFLLNQKEQMPGYSTPAAFNELRTEEITDDADMLFFRIKEFLVERQQPSVRIPLIALGIISMGGIFWFALSNAYVTAQGQQVVRLTPGFVISIIALGVSMVVGLNVNNYLSLETKGSKCRRGPPAPPLKTRKVGRPAGGISVPKHGLISTEEKVRLGWTSKSPPKRSLNGAPSELGKQMAWATRPWVLSPQRKNRVGMNVKIPISLLAIQLVFSSVVLNRKDPANSCES
jgi:hypothetical protein